MLARGSPTCRIFFLLRVVFVPQWVQSGYMKSEATHSNQGGHTMTATHYLVSSKGEEYFACRACTDVICDADHASCASLHGDGRRKCELRYDGCLDRQPLMVFWYDSTDVTNRRKMLSLSLLSPEGQRGTLYECERNHPSDVWPAAQRIGSGYSVKSAEKIAKRMGLARADA